MSGEPQRPDAHRTDDLAANAGPESGGPPDGPADAPERAPDRGPDPARALLARARADARTAPRPGARRRRRPGRPDRLRAAAPARTSATRSRSPLRWTRLTVEHGWEVDLSVHAVLARWPELVGADLAAHCQPEGFADGVLTIRAESTAWATQLRLLASAAGRAAQRPGRRRHGAEDRGSRPRRARSWSHGSRSVRGRGPRDTYG